MSDDKPTSTAHLIARRFFGASHDPAVTRRVIVQWLVGAGCALIFIPLLFYLRFGAVGALGWGLTVFLTAYCLLAAIGLFFLNRPAYHTPIPLRNDWLDRLGAFWLVACVFGPFLGWALTTALPLTADTWRWLYAARVALSIGAPVVCALPLLRYARGRGTLVMLALLIGVTALPVWSAWGAAQDLAAGPVTRAATLYLAHTDRVLDQP